MLAEAGAEALTCGEALVAPLYVHLLAGRAPSAGARRSAVREVRDRWRSDPASTDVWLGRMREDGARLELMRGLEGAEARARGVWHATAEQGLITSGDGGLWSMQRTTLAPWANDDAAELSLTEMDMEGWIYLASLCRQAQGAGSLRLSLSDRVAVYRLLKERFLAGSRREKIALAAVGPYWGQVKGAWARAPYQEQQAWMQAAPLPPPMSATSLGYAEAVIRGDVVGLVVSVHDHLGPFSMVKDRPFFQDAR